MLEKERFLAIKKLASKINKENKDFFKKISKLPVDEAVQEKEEFIEGIIDSMEIEFDEGEQGREEKQIFRANILIPDDTDFFNAYSKDKNIRNLMNKYAVSLEDIMSKITELNIYGNYIDNFEEDSDDFIEEMVNISSKEAENLLDEIEDLSSVMESLNIPIDNITEDTSLLEPEEIEEETDSKESSEELPDFDNISKVVSGFVDEYDNLQKTLDDYKQKLDEALEQIDSLKAENETLKKNNLDAAGDINKAKDAKNRLEAENIKLKDQIKEKDAKLAKTSALLKKIYNSIPRNR